MTNPPLALFSAVLVFKISLFNADNNAMLDEVWADVISDFVTSAEFGTTRSVCKPVPSTMSLCNGIGYEAMRLPNLLGHDNVKEAQQQLAAWIPLLNKSCHGETRKFLCSLFAPACLAELSAAVPPCRSLCTSVRDGCLPVMSVFGFPWPEAFNCSRFPIKEQLCIPGAVDVGHMDVTEMDKGTMLCDACSPASEGESEIQKNFCSSQFAFRLQIGTFSLEGVDLRMVPLGRSRILRWEGSDLEQQAAMKQSALWLPEAANCSCQALEGSVGSLLALGSMQDGRMVLSRLVRWSRNDKDLKKFIRKLTRQPC